VISHGLLVDVEALNLVMDQVAVLDEVEEIGPACRVHFFGVGVGLSRKSDLRLVHVEETHGVSRSHLTGLLRVEGVVGGGDHLVAMLLVGEVGLEGTDFDHFCVLRDKIITKT